MDVTPRRRIRIVGLSPSRRRRRWRRLALIGFAIAIALLPATVLAAEIVTRDEIVISTPVDGDLYLFGSDIRIDARVNGDIIATAARVLVNAPVTGSVHAVAAELDVRGSVGGSIMVAAATVNISGDVGHAVRAVASEVRITGATITGDAVLVASQIHLDNRTTVDGDVIVRSSAATINADIGRELRGNAGSLRVGGTVGGEIVVTADTLRFTPGARITQPVTYTSDREMLVDGGTIVTGTITRLTPDHPTFAETIANSLLFALFRFAWGFAFGLLLLRFVPQVVTGVSDVLRLAPGRSAGWGALTLFGTPLVVLVLAVTVVAIPVAIVVLAAYVFALYASQIVVGFVLGRTIAPRSWQRLERQKMERRTLALGLAIIVLVRSLPIPGWYPIVALVTAVAALGAITIYFFRERPEAASPAQVA